MNTKFFKVQLSILSLCLGLGTTSFAQRNVSIATASNQPVTVSLTAQPQSQNKCLGTGVSFSTAASGTSPFTYVWKKDGSVILGANNSTLNISSLALADEAIYTVEATNLCRTVTSNGAELKVVQVSTDAGLAANICPGNSTPFQATATSNHPTESGTFSYTWLPATGLSDSHIANPSASPLQTTTYALQATDGLNCSATDNLTAFVQNPYENEQICLVTVDHESGKNKVMWEKTANKGSEYYLIYKETGTDSYSQIGYAEATQNGEYVDIFSNPESHGDKYKITVLDTCANESGIDNCFYHKTVNLTIAASGTTMGLNWDDYVDESGSFVPFRYYIYKGLSADNLFLFDSVSGSFNSYNDVNVTDLYYYMIGVKKNSGCNLSRSTPLLAYSNKKNNSAFVNVPLLKDLSANLSISPNPMQERTTLHIQGVVAENLKSDLSLLDLSGKLVRTIERSQFKMVSNGLEIEIERANLPQGIYIVELKGDYLYRGKLVVE